MSTLTTVGAIEQAVAKKILNQTDPSNAGMFLKDMGHTEEAEKNNRSNFYALDDHFGSLSVFYECSFRVWLLVKDGEQVSFVIRILFLFIFVLFFPHLITILGIVSSTS